MAIADDPIEVRLQQLKEGFDSDIERDLSDATVAAILALIPGIGSAIQSLVDGKARRNVERRWTELLANFKAQLEEIRNSIPDENYYGSEEFQTLLALAYEQLWTTHDGEKLRMLAAALANSGNASFQADDKELMIRALRNLSPSDIKNLDHEYLKNWFPLTKRIEYGADVLGSLARLASSGLVIEKFLKPNPNANAEQKMVSLLDSPPWRTFQLSPFGECFLKFVASSGSEQEASANAKSPNYSARSNSGSTRVLARGTPMR
ncbi:MAG TPA: hypothetical protein VHX11_01330 [Acidobacteriaceae bacterium]|jgi:hypothetical protein|nr:hypothetical protein [Acidobacteriaceae bacterium]